MLLPPLLSFFFFNDTATTEIYTLSLHDALPISRRSTSSHRPCAERFRASTTSTSSNGSSGWASFSGPRSARSPSSRTTCSSDESPARVVVVRSPPRSRHALLHRDVGAVQLLRDARVPHPVHDEGAR